jgi:hypothetical protein
MRHFLALASLLAALLCASYVDVSAGESGDFIEWALQQGKACDRKWNSFVQAQPDGSGSPRSCGEPRRTSSFASREFGPSLTGKGSTREAGMPFLQRSTRERGGPSRGTMALKNPAAARLNVPYDRLRPAKSSLQFRRHFGPRSGAIRPYNKPTHRIRTLSSWRKGSSRPAYRASRPRR